uniref:Uncharacterized protein n=1 Tax=Lutzomyia longipalpis TaxID=7200 RepID=A0A1B0CHG9_LUTLO
MEGCRKEKTGQGGLPAKSHFRQRKKLLAGIIPKDLHVEDTCSPCTDEDGWNSRVRKLLAGIIPKDLHVEDTCSPCTDEDGWNSRVRKLLAGIIPKDLHVEDTCSTFRAKMVVVVPGF